MNLVTFVYFFTNVLLEEIMVSDDMDDLVGRDTSFQDMSLIEGK